MNSFIQIIISCTTSPRNLCCVVEVCGWAHSRENPHLPCVRILWLAVFLSLCLSRSRPCHHVCLPSDQLPPSSTPPNNLGLQNKQKYPSLICLSFFFNFAWYSLNSLLLILFIILHHFFILIHSATHFYYPLTSLTSPIMSPWVPFWLHLTIWPPVSYCSVPLLSALLGPCLFLWVRVDWPSSGPVRIPLL